VQKLDVIEIIGRHCDTGSDGPGLNGAVMQRQHAQQPWMNYVDVAGIARRDRQSDEGPKHCPVSA
jgi:hypothetical protein